jgi:ribosomal protein S12 methylthiotransferase
VKEKRYHLAMRLQQKISKERQKQNIGKVLDVLVENKDLRSRWLGSDALIKSSRIDGVVFIHSKKALNPGAFIRC